MRSRAETVKPQKPRPPAEARENDPLTSPSSEVRSHNRLRQQCVTSAPPRRSSVGASSRLQAARKSSAAADVHRPGTMLRHPERSTYVGSTAGAPPVSAGRVAGCGRCFPATFFFSFHSKKLPYSLSLALCISNTRAHFCVNEYCPSIFRLG